MPRDLARFRFRFPEREPSGSRFDPVATNLVGAAAALRRSSIRQSCKSKLQDRFCVPAVGLRGSFSLGDGKLGLWDQPDGRHFFNKPSRLFRSEPGDQFRVGTA